MVKHVKELKASSEEDTELRAPWVAQAFISLFFFSQKLPESDSPVQKSLGLCGVPPSFVTTSLGIVARGNSDQEGDTCCDLCNLSQTRAGMLLTSDNLLELGR